MQLIGTQPRNCHAKSSYVTIRQHTSAYVSIQHTSAHSLETAAQVSIRQRTPAYVCIRLHTSAYSIRLYTSAYVCIQHTSAPSLGTAARSHHTSEYSIRQHPASELPREVIIRQHTSAHVSIQHTSAHSLETAARSQHSSAYVSIRHAASVSACVRTFSGSIRGRTSASRDMRLA